MKIASRTAFYRELALTSVALLGCLTAFQAAGQTTSNTLKKIPPPAPAKPAPAAAKPATPAATAKATTPVAKTTTPATAKKAATPTPVAATTPVSKTVTTPATAASTSQPTTTTSTAGTTAIPGTIVPSMTSGPTSSSVLNSFPSSSTPATGTTAAGDPRAPVAGQGIGTFLWQGGWTLTAYGCFRTGARLFCDFDTTNQTNQQASAVIWSGAGGVNVVDDGGKITPRHNAFFVGTDGSQFPVAYVSPQPVRFIIEYDDVDPRYTSVSLVLVQQRIQGVPITPVDPSTPAGTIPARAGVRSSARGGAPATTAGSTDGIDKATQAVNVVNDQKKKAQDLWKTGQSTVQPH